MSIAALLVTAVLAQATAVTGPAESVTTGSAVVTGTVDAGATYHFEYGTTSNYGLRTPDAVAGADGAARQTLTNLTPNTTYHYRVRSGDAVGADRTFRTAAPPRAPSVSSRSATAITAAGATLRASVNPRGLPTTVYFEWGPTTAYGNVTPAQAIGDGTSAVVVSAPIAGLQPNTRYRFRAVATSPAGVTRGGSRSFRTARAPTGVTIAPTTLRPVWGSGLGLSGTVGGVGRVTVALERQNHPFTGPFVEVASTRTNSRGAYTFTMPGLFVTTRLRVVTRTAVAAASPVVTARVAVRVSVRRARLSSRRYRVTGSIWPAVPNGRVSLQRRTRSGRWLPVARTRTTPLRGDRSRYRFTVRRRSRAHTYRVVVVPRDGGAHVNGHSRVIRIPARG